MRTTITVPDSLIARADALVGTGDITTRNQLIVEAIAHLVKEHEEAKIDDEFAMMAEDTDYQSETLEIESEFSQSDAQIAALNND